MLVGGKEVRGQGDPDGRRRRRPLVTALGRSERLSLTGAQVHLGEEESGASTEMAKKGDEGLGAAIYISARGQRCPRVYDAFGTARQGGIVGAVDGVGSIGQLNDGLGDGY